MKIAQLASIDTEALARHGFTESLKALEIPYWERAWPFIGGTLAKKRPHGLSEAQRSWRDRLLDGLRP